MNPWKISTVVLAGALGLVLSLDTASAGGKSSPFADAKGHLNQAKSDLEKADADKEGHLNKAKDAIGTALNEVNDAEKAKNATGGKGGKKP